MKVQIKDELYFNLVLFEGNATQALKENSGLFTLLAAYVSAKDEYNMPINDFVSCNQKIAENEVAQITRLLTNGNVDYIINSDITKADIDDFLFTNLGYEDPWEEAYEFMKLYKGTDEELTYKEVMDTILTDSMTKEYNPDTYAKEIIQNTRLVKTNADLKEMICADISRILTKYNPLEIATDREDFKNICKFLIDVYIKMLLTLNVCLVNIKEDASKEKVRHTSIISIILGYEPSEFEHEIMKRVFGETLIVNEYDKEDKMMSIFRANEYYYTRILDTLINSGNILLNIKYHANTVVLTKEYQKECMGLLDYMRVRYPITITNNNLRDIKPKTTKKIERKKKPKTHHKKK